MAGNKFRVKPNAGTLNGGQSIFSSLERRLMLDTYFEEGFPVHYVPRILFVLVLGLLYIGNTHYAEQTVRKINRIQVEVEDLRADYTTLKAELMYGSKQSEVAKKVRHLGLKESLIPPHKVVVRKGEY